MHQFIVFLLLISLLVAVSAHGILGWSLLAGVILVTGAVWLLQSYFRPAQRSQGITALFTPSVGTAFAEHARTTSTGEVLLPYQIYKSLRQRFIKAGITSIVLLVIILLGLRTVPVLAILIFPAVGLITLTAIWALWGLITTVPAGERLSMLKTLVIADPRSVFAQYAATTPQGELKVGYTTYKRLVRVTSALIVLVVILTGWGLLIELRQSQHTADQNVAATLEQLKAVTSTVLTGQGDLKEQFGKLVAQSLQPAPTVDENSITAKVLAAVTKQLPPPATEIVHEDPDTLAGKTTVTANATNSVGLSTGASYVFEDKYGRTYAIFDDADNFTISSIGNLNVQGKLKLSGTTITTTAADLNKIRALLNSSFITLGTSSTLDNERNLTVDSGLSLDDNGAGKDLNLALDLGLTAGAIPFGSSTGNLTEDASYLSYDLTTHHLGLGTTSPEAKFQLNTGSSATKGLLIKSAPSQSANLVEWQDSDGTQLGAVTKDLDFISGPLSATSITGDTYAFESSGNSVRRLALYTANDTLGYRSSVQILRSRGTVSSPSAVQSGDNLGEYAWLAYAPDGTWQLPAMVQASIDGSPSGSSVPTKFSFITGTTSLDRKERLRITNDGQVVINPTANADAATKLLQIKATASQTGNLLEFQNSSGTALTVVNSSGEIGIGTTEPEDLLELRSGSLRISDSSSVYDQLDNEPTGYGFTVSGSAVAMANGKLRLGSVWSGLGLYSGDGSTKYNLNLVAAQGKGVGIAGNLADPSTGAGLWVSSGNNVGIGTTAPTYGLQVAPTANVTAGQTVFIQDATASTGATKVIIKAGAGQDTTDLQQWQNFSGTTLSRISNTGALLLGTPSASSGNLNLTQAGSIYARNSTNTGDLRILENGKYLGNPLADAITIGGGSTPKISIQAASALDLISAAVGINQSTPDGQLHVVTTSASRKGLIVQGAASQTANLLEIESSDGTSLTYITASGQLNAGDGVVTKVSAGACTDTTFTTDTDGNLCIDSTDGRIYFRYGGAWHYSAQTAGFQIPNLVTDGKNETDGLAVGDYVIGRLNQKLDDGALHGLYEKFDLAAEVNKILTHTPGLTLQDIKTLAVQGTLTVQGNSIFLGNVTVKGTLTRSNEQAGFAMIPKGQQEVRINFKQPFASKPIVTFSVEGTYEITAGLHDSSPSGFAIRLAQSAPADIHFTWVALNIPDAQTVIGQSDDEELQEPTDEETSSESPNSKAVSKEPVEETKTSDDTATEPDVPPVSLSADVDQTKSTATHSISADDAPVSQPTTDSTPPLTDSTTTND